MSLDAPALVGHLVPAGSVFALLTEHRCRVFPDGSFADLFGLADGAPSIPADVIASVLMLQTLHHLSDREAVETLRCDLRCNAACGLALADEGFHPCAVPEVVRGGLTRASTLGGHVPGSCI